MKNSSTDQPIADGGHGPMSEILVLPLLNHAGKARPPSAQRGRNQTPCAKKTAETRRARSGTAPIKGRWQQPRNTREGHQAVVSFPRTSRIPRFVLSFTRSATNLPSLRTSWGIASQRFHVVRLLCALRVSAVSSACRVWLQHCRAEDRPALPLLRRRARGAIACVALLVALTAVHAAPVPTPGARRSK